MRQHIAKRYLLQGRLGAGGMGEVYRADDRLTGATVALKRVLITPDSGGGGQATMALPATVPASSNLHNVRLALAVEFRTLASLRHPHIIPVLDYGFDDDLQPFFTMPLLQHPQHLLQAAHQQDRAGQIRLLLQVLQALAYLHRRGIIHRDLKPDNILIEPGSGQVRVLDFGLATHNRRVVEAAGTPLYMAPEVLREQPTTPAADIYAVGVLAYEMFTGQPLYPHEQVQDILMAKFAPPDTSAITDVALRALIDTWVTPEAADREGDAQAAIHALCAATDTPIPAESATIRESFLQAADFIGRKQELQVLQTALDGVVERLRRVEQDDSQTSFLIGGESGVGKSRLLEELRVRALVRGVLVLRGQGVQGGGLPYQLWRDVVRRVLLMVDVSDLEAAILRDVVADVDVLLGRSIADAPPMTGEAAQRRLSLTLVDVFRRVTQPVLLLLEDLQWASESLEPLKRLLPALPHMPVLIVGTYRSDERPDLPNDLPEMHVMPLSRLSATDMADLSASMLGEAGRRADILHLLQQETEGNAFFMVEIVRALAEKAGSLSNISTVSLPPTIFAGGVQDIINRRLSQMPDWAQPLLRQVALLGRQVDERVLRHLPGPQHHTHEAFLLACAEAAVLEVVDNQWRFAHDKLRETLVNALDDEQARPLHAHAARALVAVYGDDDAYARAVTHHALQGGLLSLAWQYAKRAVPLLLRTSGSLDVLELTTPLQQHLADDTAAQIQLLNWRGDAHNRLGDFEAARVAYDESIRLATHARQTTPDDTTLTTAMIAAQIGLGDTIYNGGDIPQARALLEETIPRARANGHRPTLAAALKVMGRITSHGSERDLSDQCYRESAALFHEEGDYQGEAGCINNMGVNAYYAGDIAAARAYYQQALDLFVAVGDRAGEALLLNNLALFESGNFAATLPRYERAIDLYRQAGDRWGMALVLSNYGKEMLLTGDMLAARQHIATSLTICEAIGDMLGIGYAQMELGIVAYFMGDTDLASAQIQAAMATANELDDVFLLSEATAAAATNAIMAGDLTQGRDYLRQLLAKIGQSDDRLGQLRLVMAAALLALASDAVAQAMTWVQGVKAHPALDMQSQQLWLKPLQDRLKALAQPAPTSDPDDLPDLLQSVGAWLDAQAS